MGKTLDELWEDELEEYGAAVTREWVLQVWDVYTGWADPESLDWCTFVQNVDVREPDWGDFCEGVELDAREREADLRWDR